MKSRIAMGDADAARQLLSGMYGVEGNSWRWIARRFVTFRDSGVHTFVRTVPDAALQSNIVPVTFSLDKATAPAAGEGRELGLVVNSAQLSAN